MGLSYRVKNTITGDRIVIIIAIVSLASSKLVFMKPERVSAKIIENKITVVDMVFACGPYQVADNFVT